MRVVDLWRYPVKSLRGVSVPEAEIEPIGLAGDRRWLVVNEAHRYLTIRDLPEMTRIAAIPSQDGLVLRHAEAGEIAVATPAAAATVLTVTIWHDQVPARLAAPEASAFLSGVLGRPVSLVWQADSRARPVSPDFGQPEDRTSFADAYPVLLTTTESLADLNGRLSAPVDMRRFRPNIVMEGAAPWAEDGWRRVAIGGATFRVVKPCARCVITTRDPDTGAQADPAEPLRTLAGFHRSAKGGIIFGQNLIPDRLGPVAVGDTVEVLESGPSNLGSR